jgi:1-acyl-sn-glycerol-3-phosphate acyltransferase
MQNFITSFIFWVFINLWGAIIPIIYFPAFFTKDSKLADHGAKIWSIFAIWVLKKLCKIDHKIIGLEKLPPNGFVVACKHQSMWETIVMHLIFKQPVYAYKKELIHVPFYGWFLRKMSGIKIDRSGGASAIKHLIKESKKYLNNKQNIILFPQGTRVPLNGKIEEYPYHSGITAIYINCKTAVVPAALNSGIFWGKHKKVKNPGTITLQFFDPIYPGLSKEEFNQKLQKTIEEGSKKLADLQK